MDVVFKMEMSTFKDYECEGLAFPSGVAAPMPMPNQNPNIFHHKNRNSI